MNPYRKQVERPEYVRDNTPCAPRARVYPNYQNYIAGYRRADERPEYPEEPVPARRKTPISQLWAHSLLFQFLCFLTSALAEAAYPGHKFLFCIFFSIATIPVIITSVRGIRDSFRE